MKTLGKVLLTVALFGGGLWVGSTMISKADSLIGDNQPGSVNDPIVTKSYVDERLSGFESKIEQLVAEAAMSSSGSPQLQVVQVMSGQTLYAGAGTEFIVRTGKAVAVSNDGNGIPDLTGGKDLPHGSEVANNHLLLFPREGRGIKPADDSKGPVIVMVRGKYLLLNADGTPAETP